MTTKEQYLKLLLGNGVTAVATVVCQRPGCGSTDIKSWEQQTRSSDEPVSIFHKCRKCGYVDVDHGQ